MLLTVSRCIENDWLALSRNPAIYHVATSLHSNLVYSIEYGTEMRVGVVINCFIMYEVGGRVKYEKRQKIER